MYMFVVLTFWLHAMVRHTSSIATSSRRRLNKAVSVYSFPNIDSNKQPASRSQSADRFLQLVLADEYIIGQEGRRDKHWDFRLFEGSCEFVEDSDLQVLLSTWN
jgi:hypothetical protein